MAFHHFRFLRKATLVASGFAALISMGGCASNKVTRPCIDVTSSACLGEETELAIASPHEAVSAQLPSTSGQTGQIASLQAPATTTPQGNKMTLGEIAIHTITNNPTIGIARAQARNASAGVDVVNVAYMPKVDFSAARGLERTYNFESEIQTYQTRSEASIRASQLLFDFGKTAADQDWATALQESAVWRQQAQTDKILLEMIEAYLSVLEFNMQISNAMVNERAHEEMHRIIKLNFDAGNATDADVQRIVVGLEGARTLTINLRSQRRNAVSNFRRITGLEPAALEIPPRVDPARSRLAAADVEGYAATNPRLLSLEWDLVSLEAQKTSLQRDYLPEISLNASAGIQQNVQGENPLNANGRIMLSITGQLFDGGERMAKMSQLEARIDEVKYRYRQALDQLEQDIEDAARILRTASEKSNSIAQRIRASQSVVALYQQQFEAGTRTIFELLDSQKELFAAKSEQITTRFEVLRATYRAVKLNGSLVDVILGDTSST